MQFFFKMLIGHFIIIIITCFISFFFSEYQVNDSILLSCTFIFFLLLYIYSGYYFTNKKNKWYSYFAVGILGVLFWSICYSMSFESTNYKQDNNAGVWFIYELYILPKFPLYFFNSNNYSLKLDLIEKLIFPIIFSLCQFLGGYFRTYKIENII